MCARMRWGGVAVLLIFAVRSICGGDRQLIYTGWDCPTPATFRADVADFEKLKLFDGSGIFPTRKHGEGAVERASEPFSTNHWDWSDFAQSVADLEAAKPTQCTNNFLMMSANPGNVDWFDDIGWAEVVDHWRLLARLARKGGLSGLCFDAEPYRKPWSQFLYTAQPSKSQHSFADMRAKTRERGRDVMKAIAAEYPDMTIFAYRLFSDLLHSGDPTKPGVNLQTHIFGLLPAFIDGWCDAMPPGITLIDGNESAYTYQNEDEYAVTFARLKTEAPRFVSPENRAKIRRQFLVGQGIYLDGHVPGPGGKTSIDLKGMSPTSHLMTFVSAALNAADGFVWVYGEKGRFWSAKNSSEPLWTEKISGVANALRGATDPAQFAPEFLQTVKPENNLLRDVEFTNTSTNRAAKPWSTWQEASSKGAATLANGAAQLAHMQNGTVGQTVPVKPGEMYVVGAKVKETGPGEAGLLINWQENGKWVAQSERVEFVPADAPDAQGWRSISGLVSVPPEATSLSFLIFARRQDIDKGEAVFKDPMLARVSK